MAPPASSLPTWGPTNSTRLGLAPGLRLQGLHYRLPSWAVFWSALPGSGRIITSAKGPEVLPRWSGKARFPWAPRTFSRSAACSYWTSI